MSGTSSFQWSYFWVGLQKKLCIHLNPTPLIPTDGKSISGWQLNERSAFIATAHLISTLRRVTLNAGLAEINRVTIFAADETFSNLMLAFVGTCDTRVL